MSRISSLYDAYLRKAPRQSRSRSVVEAILGAASERLSRGGEEEDVTLQEVADRAGVGIGSLYDYFRDRRSILSALAAKVTEDNLRAFEAVLASTHDLSLEDGIGKIVDFCFATYTANKRVPRAVLKIAHSIGLMPTLAESQTVFAESLAAALRKRTDVAARDLELTAWTITQAMMGVMNTLVWQDSPPHSEATLRRELIALFARHLRG
ncbi:MAG: TetR family transcriptional regulator [Labilithrix sp.]|nr:TetR family transcriptional regulator [Labilithrix sp.]